MDKLIKSIKPETGSKKKWLVMGIIIAILNPIFSGLVVSYVFLTEPNLKKEGKIVLGISLVWAIILALLVNKLKIGAYR